MRKNDPDSMGRRQMNKIITKISHEIGISHFNGKLSYSRSTQRIMHAHASTFQYGKTERHIFFIMLLLGRLGEKKSQFFVHFASLERTDRRRPNFFFVKLVDINTVQ